MELLVLSVCLVALVAILAVLVFFIVIVTFPAGIPLPNQPTNPFKAKSSYDQVTPQDQEEEALPLDQFQPDFSKPMKIVMREDEETTVMEEVEDDGESSR